MTEEEFKNLNQYDVVKYNGTDPAITCKLTVYSKKNGIAILRNLKWRTQPGFEAMRVNFYDLKVEDWELDTKRTESLRVKREARQKVLAEREVERRKQREIARKERMIEYRKREFNTTVEYLKTNILSTLTTAKERLKVCSEEVPLHLKMELFRSFTDEQQRAMRLLDNTEEDLKKKVDDFFMGVTDESN